MIGKIIIGKSFRGCISYCLENKLIQDGQRATNQSRSEVLSYNLCYGEKTDLIRQFNEVRNLNPKLAKPVMHITLSFPASDHIKKEALFSIIEHCALDLGFHANQYIAIQHNDTAHQHIHIVVNRVGFDAKTVKDNHNYQKMAAYCRKMEIKHELQQVLSPRRFLSQQLRNQPRHDYRKEQLQKDITQCLLVSENVKHFEQLMKLKAYSIQRARGIVFYDSKKVRTKGSDVGYSLSKIEKILRLEKEQRSVLLRTLKQDISQGQKQLVSKHKRTAELPPLNDALYHLLKPEPMIENTPQELLKKRKRNLGHHL